MLTTMVTWFKWRSSWVPGCSSSGHCLDPLFCSQKTDLIFSPPMDFFSQFHTRHTWILFLFYCLLLVCGGIQLVNWVRSQCFWFLTKCPKLFKQGVRGELANTLAPPGISLFAWGYIHTGTAPQPFVQTKHVFLNIHEQGRAQTGLNQTAA